MKNLGVKNTILGIVGSIITIVVGFLTVPFEKLWILAIVLIVLIGLFIFFRKKILGTKIEKVKPFSDKKKFNILLVPTKKYEKDGTDFFGLLESRFIKKRDDENLTIEIKTAQGDSALSFKSAQVLGEKYKANIVLWSEYYGKGDKARIAYNIIGDPYLPAHNMQSEESGVLSQLSQISEGYLQENIDAILYFVLGIKAQDAQDYQKAINLLQKIKAKDDHVYFHLGVNYYYLNNWEESEKHYKKALEINPNLAEAHSNYGVLLKEKLGRNKEAENHYKRALEINPKKANAHYNYGLLLARPWDGMKEAENHFKKALEINPKDAEAHSNYGVLLANLGRNEESEKHYKKALEINPNLAEADYNHGNLLQRLGRNEESEKHYKKALEINPNLAEAHTNYGNLLQNSWDEMKEAEKHYKKALEINPNLAEAHNNYGSLLEE